MNESARRGARRCSGSGRSSLFTLVGTGGCGKTRLAWRWRGTLRPTTGRGLVGRVGASRRGLEGMAPRVPEAVSGALGLRVEPSRPALDTLRRTLRR